MKPSILSNSNISFLTGYQYKALVDKSYCGIYKFDPHVFETEKALKIVVSSEGEDKTISIKLPKKLQKLIVEDFEPYWSYVREQEAKKSVKTELLLPAAGNSKK